MTSAATFDVDDLLCLPIRLRIVVAARDRISLSDIYRIAGDRTGAYYHQTLRLEEANYVKIHRSPNHTQSHIIETTILGRKRLTKHIAAIRALMDDLGIPELPSAAIPRLRGKQ
jgi:hypothetical protein